MNTIRYDTIIRKVVLQLHSLLSVFAVFIIVVNHWTRM